MPRRGSYSRSIRPHPYNSRLNMNHHHAPAMPPGSGSSAFSFPILPIASMQAFPRTSMSSLPRTSMPSFPTLESISNRCPYCPMRFMTNQALADHLPIHCGGSNDRRMLPRGMLENVNMTLVRQRLASLGSGLSLSPSFPPENTLGVGGPVSPQGSNGYVGLGVLEPPVNTGRPLVEYDFLGLLPVMANEVVDSDGYSSEETKTAPEVRQLWAAAEVGDEGDSSSTRRSWSGLDLSLSL